MSLRRLKNVKRLGVASCPAQLCEVIKSCGNIFSNFIFTAKFAVWHLWHFYDRCQIRCVKTQIVKEKVGLSKKLGKRRKTRNTGWTAWCWAELITVFAESTNRGLWHKVSMGRQKKSQSTHWKDYYSRASLEDTERNTVMEKKDLESGLLLALVLTTTK